MKHLPFQLATLLATCIANAKAMAQTATEATAQATQTAQTAASAVTAAAQPAVQAAAQSPATASSLLQMLLGFAIVLALLVGIAWLMKRMGVTGPAASSVARVVGGVSVGNRERVLVVEVGDQWIVVGVAPGRVNALSTLPRQERGVPATATAPDFTGAKTFAAWLKQTIDKRNGNTQ